ncbi:MAG: cyclic-di-AMP receptor [Anaerolineae bacterium]|nr:cyclic-di-AMP receptor [Anaerolineae bacterium]MDW8102218.1 cyclic-di-AMP receptor [Anaerolineae bacterium]
MKKLVLAIIKDDDAPSVMEALISRNFRVTKIASTGGFLRRGNVTLLIGTEEERVEELLKAVTRACAEPPPGQHRAIIFVIPMEQFIQVG